MAAMSDVSYVKPPSDLTIVRGIGWSGMNISFLPSSSMRKPGEKGGGGRTESEMDAIDQD